jgi:hypothetical protein
VFADTLQIWDLGGLRAFRAVADALARPPAAFSPAGDKPPPYGSL